MLRDLDHVYQHRYERVGRITLTCRVPYEQDRMASIGNERTYNTQGFSTSNDMIHHCCIPVKWSFGKDVVQPLRARLVIFVWPDKQPTHEQATPSPANTVANSY